jgi:hypothetical protein
MTKNIRLYGRYFYLLDFIITKYQFMESKRMANDGVKMFPTSKYA